MQDQQQHVLGLAAREQPGAEREFLGEAEDAAGGGGQFGGQLRLGHGGGVDDGQQRAHRLGVPDVLPRLPVDRREHCPQHLVAGHHVAQGAVQCRDVEGAGEP